MTAQPRDVVEVLTEHVIECTGLGEVTCRGCRDRGWMSWTEYRRHVVESIAAEGYPVTAAGLAQVKAEAWDEGAKAMGETWTRLIGWATQDEPDRTTAPDAPDNPYCTEEHR